MYVPYIFLLFKGIAEKIAEKKHLQYRDILPEKLYLKNHTWSQHMYIIEKKGIVFVYMYCMFLHNKPSWKTCVT